MIIKMMSTLSYTRDPDERLKRIGRKVRFRRKVMDLTREELGERCGYSEASIRKIEQGAVDLSITRLFQLAEALDVNLSYLLELEEVPTAGGEVVINYEDTYGEECAELNVLYKRLAIAAKRVKERSNELLEKDLDMIRMKRKGDRHNEIYTDQRKNAC